MADADIRKGMPPVNCRRMRFERRYRSRYADPVFQPLLRELSAIIDAAWVAHSHSRNLR